MPGRSESEIKDVNVRYHDAAAAEYDTKWGVDFGPGGQAQVLNKVQKALGRPPGRFERALEIGAGTGYFSLNLAQTAVVAEAVATDISPGMVAQVRRSAERLEVRVEAEVAAADDLPFPTGSFDLVVGHAVLHHLPDLARAFSEFRRVLRPGGSVVFCGEPSRQGDRLAAVPKRFGMVAAPVWRRVVRAGPRRDPLPGPDGHEQSVQAELEPRVDVRTFSPGELLDLTRGAGFEDVRVTGEELAANAFGWVSRTLESTAEPDQVPFAWQLFAHRGYLALQKLDQALLEPRLPAWAFYNLLLSGRAPT